MKNFRFKATMKAIDKKLDDMLEKAEDKQEKLTIEHYYLWFILDCLLAYIYIS